MHVTTEQQENCVLDLHIELPPERFEKEWKRIAEEYARLARIPGFRKGKAPLSAIEKKYGADIEKEALEKTIENALREVILDKQIHCIQHPKLQKKELHKDRSLHFTANIITKPEIDLPEYRNLSLSVEKESVTEARLDELLEEIRSDFAEFLNITDRGLEMGDFAVVDYEATVEGKPLLEIDPNLPLSFVGGKNRWMQLNAQHQIPGLGESLVGMTPQESRTSYITFPPDFSVNGLRDLKVTYEVTLHEIKRREPAPLDDTLAVKIKPGLTLEGLRDSIRNQLATLAEEEFHKKIRIALVDELIKITPIEIPTPLLHEESYRVLEKVIHENQSRGVSEETIRSRHEELLQSAQKQAEEILKTRFILHAIALQEKIEVTQDELVHHLSFLAERYKMTLKKLVAELQKNHALSTIQQEVLMNKTLDFLITHANITEMTSSKKPDTLILDHHAEHHVHGPECRH